MNKVTDPKLLEQLNAPENKVTDPALLAQLNREGQQEQETVGNYWHHPAARVLADIAIGAAEGGQGLHNAPYNISRMFNPEFAEKHFPHHTHWNFSKGLGVANPNIADKLIQGATQYAPGVMMGGSGVLGQTLSNAAYGALQSGNPAMGAAIGGAGGLVGSLGSKLIPAIAKGTKGTIKELSNIPAFGQSPKVLRSLGQELNPNSIAAIEDAGSKFYEPVMEKAGAAKVLENPAESEYLKVIAEEPLTTKSAASKLSTKNFLNEPTIDKAHRLQDALGDRIREYNILEKKNGALPEEDANIRQAYMDARDALMKDIHSTLKKVDPALSIAYKDAAKNWATNVEPWRIAAKQLRDLGDNPSISQIVKAFGKITTKATSISSNRPSTNLPIPEGIQKHITSLKDAIEGRNALKKLGLAGSGAAALSLGGYGINRLIGGE